MHVTTPPTRQASPLYEIIMEVDKECGGDDNEHDYENYYEDLQQMYTEHACVNTYIYIHTYIHTYIHIINYYDCRFTIYEQFHSLVRPPVWTGRHACTLHR